MKMTASKLRQNIYRVLDEVLDSGVPLEIERRGKILKISPPETTSKFSRLEKRDCILVEPQELVHIDWSDEWKP
ncbi:MAG TPA: type II toxin-antitoxin system Phd/YefM family antitoxin [Thermoanaerobaculia bacterium]|nr:type II toxin-antitoxin system Phd/YefM family antitoxin [Thermoanaerobaculia bacterium]